MGHLNSLRTQKSPCLVDRVVVMLTRLCRLCKGCARRAEAKAQQPPPAAASGGKKGKGKGKMKKKEEEKYTSPHCMNCKKQCTVPVNKLMFDVAVMKGFAGNSAKEVPQCGICEDGEATKFCKDCHSVQQMLCDGCYTSSHMSAKKQGHSHVQIDEHHASASTSAVGAAAAVMTTMCDTHIGHTTFTLLRARATS